MKPMTLAEALKQLESLDACVVGKHPGKEALPPAWMAEEDRLPHGPRVPDAASAEGPP